MLQEVGQSIIIKKVGNLFGANFTKHACFCKCHILFGSHHDADDDDYDDDDGHNDDGRDQSDQHFLRQIIVFSEMKKFVYSHKRTTW